MCRLVSLKLSIRRISRRVPAEASEIWLLPYSEAFGQRGFLNVPYLFKVRTWDTTPPVLTFVWAEARSEDLAPDMYVSREGHLT